MTAQSVSSPPSTTYARKANTARRNLMLADIFTHAVLITVTVIMLFPIFWVISTSFKPQAEVESSTVTLFPQRFTLENYNFLLTICPRAILRPDRTSICSGAGA